LKKKKMKIPTKKKETVNGMLQHTTGCLAQAGHYLDGKYLWSNKLCGSRQVYVARHCANPPERYLQSKTEKKKKTIKYET
jgi:hypothetical protein